MTDIEADADPELDDEHVLMAELLFEAPPTVDPARLAADVQETMPGTVVDDSDDTVLLVHHDHTRRYEEGPEVPILTALLRPDDDADQVASSDYDLSQTWNWPDAADVVGRCTTSMAVVEMMGRAHPPKARVTAFRTSLLAVAAQAKPLAIWWPISEQMVRPDELGRHELVGLANVRLFRVDDPDGDDPGVLVMDTLGLGALGLPDVQCHFRTLDPRDMARMLYNLAAYLYERGDLVEDGQTVTGITGDEAWECQHEIALVDPQRQVLDVNPGPPYAAGTREVI